MGPYGLMVHAPYVIRTGYLDQRPRLPKAAALLIASWLLQVSIA